MSTSAEAARSSTGTTRKVSRRLRPLYVAVFLQSFVIWFAAEKLFLDDIGFTPADIGLMAAVYAAVVPLVEFPSGVLADRWSRRGIFVVSCLTMAVCSALGGLSQGVWLYLVCAAFLGVTIAMESGAVDSMVYDLLVEETGDGSDFTRWVGRARLLQGLGLTAGAILGGVLSELTAPRATYFATEPPLLAAVVVVLWFREPRLNRTEERVSLRDQVLVTIRTIGDRGAVIPALVLGAVSGVALQLVYEFGPLWLVALAVPAVLFGPHAAALTATLAAGGALAARMPWSRKGALTALGAAMTVAAAITAVSHDLMVIFAAQVVAALALVLVEIHATQRLHDAIPSQVRAGVASGASTVTWLAFVPAALAFGWVAEVAGVHTAGWLFTALVALSAVLLLLLAVQPPAADDDEPTCSEVVRLASDYADGNLTPAEVASVDAHRRLCPGCDRYVAQVRELLRGLASLR